MALLSIDLTQECPDCFVPEWHRIMLHYPKIPGSRDCPGGRCVAFEKYDGTNLHWDWDREFGWHSFGTRRDEFALSPVGVERFEQAHPGLGQSAEVFRSALAAGLEGGFREGAAR